MFKHFSLDGHLSHGAFSGSFFFLKKETILFLISFFIYL